MSRVGRCQRDREQDERRPRGRVRPDADGLQERGAEDAGRARGDHGVEGVGAEQAPARDHPGPRAERGADERVDRAGMVEVLAQPDEGVGHQQHADGRDEEGQRHGAARRGGARLRVDVRGHARRHQRHRQAHRRPYRQRTFKPRCAGRVRFHLLLLTVLGPHSVPPTRPSRKGRKIRKSDLTSNFSERAVLRAPLQPPAPPDPCPRRLRRPPAPPAPACAARASRASRACAARAPAAVLGVPPRTFFGTQGPTHIDRHGPESLFEPFRALARHLQ